MTQVTITADGYEPVTCDEPLPCPFCGSAAVLAQLAHRDTFDRKGKRQRICIVASSSTLTSDTFWFRCSSCHATTGPHCKTAQDAATHWNKRSQST